MNLYPFIEAGKAEHDGNVAMACRMLEVSRAAYYEWSKQSPSSRQLSDADLTEKIVEVHAASRGTYGAPRITSELREEGICVGKKRVARLMVRAGLAGRCKRRWKKTTIADPDAVTAAVDLIRREFGIGVREIDTAWCGDISYIGTWEGWLYLATVIDLASRRVVGFVIADHMRADLVCDALSMAIEQRRPGPAATSRSTSRGSTASPDDPLQLAALLVGDPPRTQWFAHGKFCATDDRERWTYRRTVVVRALAVRTSTGPERSSAVR